MKRGTAPPTRLTDQQLSPFDLSVGQYQILTALVNEPASIALLSEVLGIAKEALGDFTQDLADRGLIERKRQQRDGTKPVIHLHITEQGLTILAAIEASVNPR